jgi:hypothetical protein
MQWTAGQLETVDLPDADLSSIADILSSQAAYKDEQTRRPSWRWHS